MQKEIEFLVRFYVFCYSMSIVFIRIPVGTCAQNVIKVQNAFQKLTDIVKTEFILSIIILCLFFCKLQNIVTAVILSRVILHLHYVFDA